MRQASELARLLDEQLGVITREQLTQMAFTDDWLRARLASGAWRRLYRSTYVTFTGAMSFESRVSAAVLRAGPGAAACERTAAALYGLVPVESAGSSMTILVPRARRVRLEPGLGVRYSSYAEERTHPLWWPRRTYLEDTVLDLAARSTALTDVVGWVTRATNSGKTSTDRIGAALSLRRQLRWSGPLRAMLDDVADGATSPLEMRYLHRVERAHRLPPAVRQRAVRLDRLRLLDVDYDEFDVRIELDGRVGHESDGVFRDRVRDNASGRQGRITLRYGWGDTFDRPCAVAREVAEVLRSRGWTGRPDACGPQCRATGTR